jgi:exonuclease SbcD
MKKPISCILTDTHLKEENIEIVTSIFKQAIDITKSLGLKRIEHAGDIFNSRKAQTQVALDALDNIFEYLKEKGVEMDVVVGNHDKTDYGSEVSFIKQFRYHPAVTIHNTFGSRECTKETALYYLSYFDDEVYIENFRKVKARMSYHNCKKHVLITHIGCAGAVMNSGTVVESKVTTALFDCFDRVYIGHYHDAQSLSDKVHYIGSSLQHNYGEKTGKGLTVLYDDLSTETIPLKYPQYIKYEVKPSEITKKDLEDLKVEKEQSGDNIRVVLVGNDKELKSFNKQHLENAGISVQHKQDVVKKEELEQRVEPFDEKAIYQEFKSFCKKHNLDVEKGMKYFKAIFE